MHRTDNEHGLLGLLFALVRWGTRSFLSGYITKTSRILSLGQNDKLRNLFCVRDLQADVNAVLVYNLLQTSKARLGKIRRE